MCDLVVEFGPIPKFIGAPRRSFAFRRPVSHGQRDTCKNRPRSRSCSRPGGTPRGTAERAPPGALLATLGSELARNMAACHLLFPFLCSEVVLIFLGGGGVVKGKPRGTPRCAMFCCVFCLCFFGGGILRQTQIGKSQNREAPHVEWPLMGGTRPLGQPRAAKAEE